MAQSSDEATLLSLEQKWIDMDQAHDIAGLSALLDDDYRADTYAGMRSKADSLIFPPGVTSQTLRNLRAHVDGDRGMVSGENLTVDANGKLHKMEFIDRFVRKNGQWRVIYSYITN